MPVEQTWVYFNADLYLMKAVMHYSENFDPAPVFVFWIAW